MNTDESAAAALTVGTEPAFEEWWENNQAHRFPEAGQRLTARLAWNAALAKAPQAAAPDPMEEFLSVCEGSCDHPYCWSQKGQNGGNNEKALVQDVPLERGISAARGVLRDVGDRVQEVRTDLVGDRLAAPTIGTEPTLPPLVLEPDNHNPDVCDCDLEGGDPDCKIQPPYKNGYQRVIECRERQLASAIAERDFEKKIKLGNAETANQFKALYSAAVMERTVAQAERDKAVELLREVRTALACFNGNPPTALLGICHILDTSSLLEEK